MSKLSLSLSVPNLPGMLPDKRAWLYREKDGFKRNSRPSTANNSRVNSPMKLGEFNQVTGGVSSPADGRYKYTPDGRGYTFDNQMAISSRPSTAGGWLGSDRGTNSSGNIFSRPQTAKLPRYVEEDKKVCRFFAHFFQDRNWEKNGPLGSPKIEQKITRYVTIYYYIVDGQTEMMEPSQVNSGIMTGKFFRKGKIMKDDGEKLFIEDLAPGNAVKMLGQTFFITDADSFTRDYFKNELNMELPPPTKQPAQIRSDVGAQYATGLGSELPAIKKNFGTRSTDYMVTKEIMDKTQQFLQSDGGALKFLCVEVFSRYPPFFPALQSKMGAEGYFDVVASAEVKRFTLSFFLSTGYVELVVQRKIGEGRDGSHDEPRMLLKKGKLPLNWRETRKGKPAVYYEPKHLRCGEVIEIYGKLFLLVNCDGYTRDFYEEHGYSQQEVLMVKEDREIIVQPVPILGDGFLPIGSNDDTLATVYGQPKVRKDVLKVQRNQGRLIRCKSILLSRSSIDHSREFNITFYLEDDTLQVHEEIKRNSGIWGGNFLKRGKYMNNLPNDSDEPRLFKATDIYLGNIVSCNGNEFQIIEMDNMSLKFCETYPDEFPFMDTFRIVDAVMLKIVEWGLDVRTIFNGFDRMKQGWIDQDCFIDVLDQTKLSADLNDQEVLTIMRRFKDENRYYYREFVDLISHLHKHHLLTEGGLKPLPSHLQKQQSGMFSPGGPGPRKRPSMDFYDLGAFFENCRCRTTQWRRIFRKDPSTFNGNVTLAVFRKLFEKHGLILDDKVAISIYSKYRVDPTEAAPVLQELRKRHANKDLFMEHDRKIKKKLSSRENARVKQHLLKHNLVQQADLRRKQSVIMSVLRHKDLIPPTGDSFASSQTEEADEPEVDYNPLADQSSIIIKFDDICDDIYVCDWN